MWTWLSLCLGGRSAGLDGCYSFKTAQQREEGGGPGLSYLFMLCSSLLCLKRSRTSLLSMTPSFLNRAKGCIKENEKKAPFPFLIPKHLLSKNPLRTCVSREGEIPWFSTHALNLRIIFTVCRCGTPVSQTLGTVSKNTHRSTAKQTNAHIRSDVFTYSNRKAPRATCIQKLIPWLFFLCTSSIRLWCSESY